MVSGAEHMGAGMAVDADLVAHQAHQRQLRVQLDNRSGAFPLAARLYGTDPEQVVRFAAEQRAARAPVVLDDAAKRTAARIAVAEVQKHHAVWSMAQLRFEVHRALPVLEAGADGEAVVTEVARLAVGGRAGAEVVQVSAPDITEVTDLGVRASDGGSIYRPPNEARYTTTGHLDLEERILRQARKQLKEWTPNSRYGGHAFGFMDPNVGVNVVYGVKREDDPERFEKPFPEPPYLALSPAGAYGDAGVYSLYATKTISTGFPSR